MQNTHNLDRLAGSLIDLIFFLNSPQRDGILLGEAGVSLDRALFPLLVILGSKGSLSVAEIAEHAGRDHTTISRQLNKLASLNLIERETSDADRRRSAAHLTADGTVMVQAIASARRRLLAEALANWNGADQKALADLSRRFADALIGLAQKRS